MNSVEFSRLIKNLWFKSVRKHCRAESGRTVVCFTHLQTETCQFIGSQYIVRDERFFVQNARFDGYERYVHFAHYVGVAGGKRYFVADVVVRFDDGATGRFFVDTSSRLPQSAGRWESGNDHQSLGRSSGELLKPILKFLTNQIDYFLFHTRNS